MASGTLRKVDFVITGNDIHVLEQGSHVGSHVVIRAPCTAATASVVTSISTSHTSSVIITTRDNHIWFVPASQLVQNDFTRETECEAAKSEEQMDTEDIFGDLLDDEAQGDAKHLNVNSLKNKSFISQNACIFTIKSQHLLHTVDGSVMDVDTMDDLMSVLVDRLETVELHVYKISTEQQDNVSEARIRLTLLESFTTGLNSSNFNNYFVKKTKCLFFAKSFQQKSTDTSSTSSTTLRSLVVSQTSICISKQLFTILFGKETACLSSPVLMLCTDNGCVYSYEVKSLKSVLKKRLRVICQLDSDIVGILPIQISQPAIGGASTFKDIMSTLASSLKEESTLCNSNQTSTCLVIFSSTGKGCLFVPPIPENDYPMVLMFTLPHPIELCIVHGESIIYSTGKSIEACELKLLQGQEDGAFSVTPVLRTLLGKARIRKLLPFALVSRGEDTMISGITCSFDLVPIYTKLKDVGPDSTAEVTHSLKDILQSIEQCSLTFKSLKKDSQCIDSFLLQLNIFASLAQNKVQTSSSDTKPHNLAAANLTNPIVACICSVLSAQNVYKRDWSLKIILKNNSSVSFSEDWIVLVTLCDSKEGLYYPMCERFKQSFSIPLSRGLQLKSCLDICLPLERLLEIHPVPAIEVTVSLALSFRDVKGGMKNMPQNVFHKCVKVEIHKQKLDILHFFHKLNGQSLSSNITSGDFQSSNVTGRGKHWLPNELDKMAHMRVTGRVTDYPVQDGSQVMNVRVGVSELECKEHKLFNSAETLSFLLKDSNLLVDKTFGPHIQLEDPHGHSFTLMVSASAADHENSDKSSTDGYPVIVTLKGEDASLLLQTRAAIRVRFKVQSSGASVSQSKSRGELRRHLTFLEGIQKDLHHIQSRLVTHKKEEEESVKLMCEMIDKGELLTKNS